jgi:Flp pilus assembly protein TadG
MNTLVCAGVRGSTKRQAGVAAVELAILMPILLVFLTFPVFFARVFWHYTVAQKAAQDAARYLSTVSAAEMMTPARAQAAGEFAQEIVRREIAELAPGSDIADAGTYCDGVNCGEKLPGTTPATVRVNFSISMFDPTETVDVGWFGLPITASYTMRYVGN